MDRELVWIEKERFEGWACSACGWEFRASRPLVRGTIEEMTCAFERVVTHALM
jgi:rubredoxin